jgi:amidohydrolase
MLNLKDAGATSASAATERIVDLSHRIHANPELAFEEHKASRWVGESLSDAGFDVEMGVADLPTAFVATAGHGPLTIGICAEYDALPGIGHACGHNIIAAAAVGAGLALAPLADDLGLTVKVFGTPAEEGGGGKILMLNRGVFDGVHAAMMVRPAPVDLDTMPCLALGIFDVHYHGREAHASGAPEQGVNATDALTVAQVGLGLLRQHIRATDKIHGIVTNGGEAPNVVPGETSGRWIVRARDYEELIKLEARVRSCFEAGALATGCGFDVEPVGPLRAELRTDTQISALYRANAEHFGRNFIDLPPGMTSGAAGSTDMGNISLVIPTIHPTVGID